jgi:DNA-binding GntR family transcriptional regulator
VTSNLIDSNSGRRQIQRSRRTLATEVYDLLKWDILTCELLPGQMINESDLVRQFEVSKTPIREALKMLTQEGLVRSMPSIGYVVAPIDLDELQEIYDMQKIFEAAAVERAIERITDEELDRLEELVGESFILSDKESIIRWFKSNTEFHIAIAEASGNRRLVEALRNVLEEMFRPGFLAELYSGLNTEVFIADHRRIVEALRRKDAKLAVELLTRQSEIGITAVIDALAKRELQGGPEKSL